MRKKLNILVGTVGILFLVSGCNALPRRGSKPQSSNQNQTKGPEKKPKVLNIKALAAGRSHTCALINESVWCWGKNDSGQLGSGDKKDSSTPAQVKGLGAGVTAIAVGGSHTCALINGGVRCWGKIYVDQGKIDYSTSQPTPIQRLATKVTQIAAGENHTCAIRDGHVYCWGLNGDQGSEIYGQLGQKDGVSNLLVPTTPEGLDPNFKFLRIATGRFHTCGVKENGEGLCWGRNSENQLGISPVQNPLELAVYTPVPLSILEKSVIDSLALGEKHSCGLVAKAVHCWGDNSEKQLGVDHTPDQNYSVNPAYIRNNVLSLTSGYQHSCIIEEGEKGLKCWGSNRYGQLGSREVEVAKEASSVFVEVTGLAKGVDLVAAGADHTCAAAQSEIFCFGSNEFGQLGNKSISGHSPVPVSVDLSGV